MLDYIETIREFMIENFSPSTPENANLKLNTEQLLGFLFQTFPAGCISDYDLNDILISLGYKRFNYVVETYIEKGRKNEKYTEVHKSLEVGWCLKSPFDLRVEEVGKK